jgi:hypothetical protein
MPRIIITVPDKTPQPYRFQLDRQTVTLGRGSDNDIAIDCGSVSVKHAEMRRVEGGYQLIDVGSTNGIKLDGERQGVIALRNGVSVTLGDVEFDFLLTAEEKEILSREKPEELSYPDEVGKEEPESSSEKSSHKKEDREEPEHEGGGCGFLMVLLFLILAAAAFFAGMAIRFQKETHGSLIDAIKAKSQVLKAPAPPVPAETK